MTEPIGATSQVWKREEQCKINCLFIYYLKLLLFLFQGVSRVVQFSSQYNDSTWSANQVIGPPNVYPRYGMNKYFKILSIVLVKINRRYCWCMGTR